MSVCYYCSAAPRDGKLLTCGHVFCEACLQTELSNCPDLILRCPNCGYAQHLDPMAGVFGLADASEASSLSTSSYPSAYSASIESGSGYPAYPSAVPSSATSASTTAYMPYDSSDSSMKVGQYQFLTRTSLYDQDTDEESEETDESSNQEYEDETPGLEYDISVEGYLPPRYVTASTPHAEPISQSLYENPETSSVYERTTGTSTFGEAAPPPQSSFEAWLKKELAPGQTGGAGAAPSLEGGGEPSASVHSSTSEGMYPYYGMVAGASTATHADATASSVPSPSTPSAYPSALPSSNGTEATPPRKGGDSAVLVPTSVTGDQRGASTTSDGIIVSEGGNLLKRRINFAQYDVTPAKLKTIYSRWLNGLWFAPTDFVKKASLNPLTMAYIPYWKFDVVAHTEYVGEVLHSKGGGKEWTRAEGSLTSDYNNNFACACSVEEERKLVMEFKRKWNWKKVHYPQTEEEAAAAIAAEENASFVGKLWKSVVKTVTWSAPELEPPPEHLLIPPLEWPTIWEEFQKVMAPQQQKKAENKLLTEQGGRRVRNVKVNVKINIKRKLIYMPLAVTSFTLDKQAYKIIINGQSGEVKGQRPYGAGKIGKLFGAGAK